jgi:hypothetical protein
MPDEFAVLHERPADDPHGVTVAATPDGIELWRLRTTGTLALFYIPARELPAVRAALEKREAAADA